MARIIWFEGSNGTQNVVREDPIDTTQESRIELNLKNHKGDNDEIRSAVLEDVPINTKITVYDNPDGKTNDDWAFVTVKKYKKRIQINDFEQSVDNPDYRLEYHRKNGLNGKISRIKIEAPIQLQRSLQAYVRDSILTEVGPFAAKSGQARELSNSNHQYRVWMPQVVETTDGGVFVNAKLDHIRGGAPDDHATFRITFNKLGMATAIDYTVNINDSDPVAQLITLQGNLAETAGKALDNVPVPEVQILSALTQLSGNVYKTMGELIREMRETGGRSVFRDVIEGRIQEVGKAVLTAYRQYQSQST